MTGLLDPFSFFTRLESSPSLRWQGHVTQVIGQMVESAGPYCSVGDACSVVDAHGNELEGEVVGFRDNMVLSMPLERPAGIRFGDRVVTQGMRPRLRVGTDFLGRVVDGAGNAIDGKGPCTARVGQPLDAAAPLALDRVPITRPLSCGVRAIDAFMTCGRGQRVGIFGGSGVGKSTLIGMMARNTSADLTVLGLIGERGREVKDFLETLGEKAGSDRWLSCRHQTSHRCFEFAPHLPRLQWQNIFLRLANTFCWWLIHSRAWRWRSVRSVWPRVNQPPRRAIHHLCFPCWRGSSSERDNSLEAALRRSIPY